MRPDLGPVFETILTRCWLFEDLFDSRPPGGSVQTWQWASSMAVWREEQQHSLPVSESRSSAWGGLVVKESLRFMEDFAFPSFPSNSLRSNFGVLVKGDNLSLLCQRWGKIKHTQRIKIGSNEAEVWPKLSAECGWICKQRSNGLK